MDASTLCGTSVSEIENREAICSSSASLEDHYKKDKLNTGPWGELNINDGNQTNAIDDVRRIPVEGYYIEEEEEENEDENDFTEEELLAQMGYAKSETKRYYEEEEEEEKEENISKDSLLEQMGYLKNEPPEHEPITTPTAYINLVAAFKGSREKDGRSHTECRVSWAPDVYDPPCTSDDHFTVSKAERQKSEHKVKGVAGKNRQKGGGKGVAIEGGGGGGKGTKPGGSKGSVKGGKTAGKGKDKKQADKKTRKYGGSASKEN